MLTGRQVHQHISRANFSAERGIRYGADFYDGRMQATRACRITVRTSDGDTVTAPWVQPEGHEGREAVGDMERSTAAARARMLKDSTASTAAGRGSEKAEGWNGKGVNTTASFTISTTAPMLHAHEADAGKENDPEQTKTSLSSGDPLRMFGLLTPPELRRAQAESITTVEEIVPQLVSVDGEMREVEIRIRRARKYRARAELLEEKEGIAVDAGGKGPVLVVGGQRERG